MKKYLVLFLILYVNLSVNLFSQDVTATARLDTNNVLIGDQIKLHLFVKSNAKTNIVFPALQDSLGKIEVLSRSKIDTVDSNGNYSLKQDFIITCFDSGYFEIPAFIFMYEKKGMPSMYPFETPKLFVKFNTVPIDTTKDIKDIKPPMDIPFNIWDYKWYILAALLAIALGFTGYWLWKKYKKKPSNIKEYDPKTPPHVIALEALKNLENEKLWHKGKVKEYYISLTEIIRIYIERRFKILALEMVTDEIISELKRIRMDIELINKINVVFRTADLAKFAKHQPLPDENSSCINLCYEFVNSTALIVVADDVQESNEENIGETK